MTPWEGKREMVVVTACADASGRPTFAITKLAVTIEEYEDGGHYTMAEDDLFDRDYESPFVHFDEDEAPAFLLPAVEKWLLAGDLM